MSVIEATRSVYDRTPFERSYFSFFELAHAIPVRDFGDELVGERELAEHFHIDPFWATSGDIEGDAHAVYRKEHPEFELSLRREAYQRLIQAQTYLPDNWQLVLKAGFRPIEVQLLLLDVFKQQSHIHHPERTEAEHLEHARTFVSDPHIVLPPHVTGGAVDVDVIHKATGNRIDMGSLPNTDSELSFLHSDGITEMQRENRHTLLHAMLEVEFSPHPYEWWHYQYGETLWAAFYDKKTTKYGLIGGQPKHPTNGIIR